MDELLYAPALFCRTYTRTCLRLYYRHPGALPLTNLLTKLREQELWPLPDRPARLADVLRMDSRMQVYAEKAGQLLVALVGDGLEDAAASQAATASHGAVAARHDATARLAIASAGATAGPGEKPSGLSISSLPSKEPISRRQEGALITAEYERALQRLRDTTVTIFAEGDRIRLW